MKKIVFLFAVFIALIGATSVMAASIVLSNYELFVDGDYYYSEDNVSGLLDDDLFVWNTGIGTLSLTFNPGAAGPYSVDAWFDHDIYNDDGDGIYEDETAEVVDDPGGNGQFGVATSDFNGFGADMWIGYDDIMLAADQYAVISFTISSDTSPGGFFIHQIQSTYSGTDYNGEDFFQDEANLYLSSTIEIRTNPVPEPATMLLFLTGFAGLIGSSYIKRKKEK